MREMESLYLSIYEYMDRAFPIPADLRGNDDVLFQVVAGRTAIEEFLSQMYDNPDIPPERILLELEIKMEKEASKHTDDSFIFYKGFEALNEIEGVFFGGCFE